MHKFQRFYTANMKSLKPPPPPPPWIQPCGSCGQNHDWYHRLKYFQGVGKSADAVSAEDDLSSPLFPSVVACSGSCLGFINVAYATTTKTMKKNRQLNYIGLLLSNTINLCSYFIICDRLCEKGAYGAITKLEI